jgi:CHAD domain-containing protein
VADHVEIEQKYDADSDFTVPDLTGLPGVHAVSAPQTEVLVANYFDTDDLRLAACGLTLRRRRGGGDAGWHLKIPAGPSTKNELRVPLGRANAVPTRLANLVAARTRGEPLRPVATLETNRTVVRLLGEDGEVLAEVADDAVIGHVLDHVVNGGRHAPQGGYEPGHAAVSTWREIEVELVDGSPDLLKTVGKRLRNGGAHRADSSSKLGRLLGDAVPVRPRRAGLPSGRIAGDAVAAYLTAQIDALLIHDPKVRLAEYDAVHKMRVAVRRIRSTLKGYRAVLDRERTDDLQPELKWLADELGVVRDLEVLRGRFTGHLDELPADLGVHRGWLEALTQQEHAGYRRLNMLLKEPRYFALLDNLDELVADPPWTDRAGHKATKELPRLVLDAWRRLEQAYDAIETTPPEERDTARHDARKIAKRARYTAEAAVPVLGAPAAVIAENVKTMQEVLGRFQDGVIAQERLAHIAAEATDPREAFTLGVLYELERQEVRTALSEVAATWAQARDPKTLKTLRDVHS